MSERVRERFYWAKIRRSAAATAAMLTVATIFLVGYVKASNAKPSNQNGFAIGCAKVSIASNSVLSFGGKGTTAVSATGGESGSVDVVFTGKFPKVQNTDQVIINATPQFLFTGPAVATAACISAGSTRIEIVVFTWNSVTGASTNDVVFVTLFIGH